MASASADKTIKIWELKTGKRIHTLVGHTGKVLNVAFADDGSKVLSASGDKTIKVWNCKTGKLP